MALNTVLFNRMVSVNLNIFTDLELDLITQVKKSYSTFKTTTKRVYKPETDFVKKLKSNQDAAAKTQNRVSCLNFGNRFSHSQKLARKKRNSPARGEQTITRSA